MTPTIPLLSPFQLADLTLKNRVVMAPLTRSPAGESRIPNELMAEYYTQRASVGLIISEATTISEQANGWTNTPGVYTEEQVAGWTKVTKQVHAKGTPMFLQLWHTGRAGHSDFKKNGELPVAPSAVKLEGPAHTPKGKKDHEIPRALEESEVPGIVEDYKNAAQNAKDAGFDGVEIHSANGYLLDQFLQSKTNHRTDAYGGSPEKRFRILKEVVQAVCTVYPSNRVGVRLSPNSAFNEMGSKDNRETFFYAFEQLNVLNLAYLHVLRPTADFAPFHGVGAEIQLSEYRKYFKGTILVNGGFSSKADAEAVIDAGEGDLIVFGRPIITNPDLVERFTHDWPLAPWADPSAYYGLSAQGYTDFPTYTDKSLAKR